MKTKKLNKKVGNTHMMITVPDVVAPSKEELQERRAERNRVFEERYKDTITYGNTFESIIDEKSLEDI